MRAVCYYEQISHEGLDGKNNQLALTKLTTSYKIDFQIVNIQKIVIKK